jgi:hypothetical protein
VVVFDTLSNILLLGIRIREGKNRFFFPITSGSGGRVSLCHTACTGSRIKLTSVGDTGKNFFDFIRDVPSPSVSKKG